MKQDRDGPDDWLERAAAQAIALHGTVQDRPHLRELVELILHELGIEVARQLPRPED